MLSTGDLDRELPERPASPSVPESGTTMTVREGLPRSITPVWWRANEPFRPASLPVTLSTAT